MPLIFEKYKISKPYIFYVGVWRNHKNIAGLIRAFKILKEEYEINCQLVLAGEENPYYPEVRETWENLNLKIEEDIILPGFVLDSELFDFYSNSLAVIIPSFVEGFGFVGLEALKAGALVAASKIDALTETLKDCAVYFDPKNSSDIALVIKNLLNDKNLQMELLRKGKELIKNYSFEKMAKETLELYNQENGIKN